MELQGLQEALKVEVQCHQKLGVRSCPVSNANKPLALSKPPSQSIAISVVSAKTPASMVTTHINGQKAPSSEVLHTSPINLQTPAGQHMSPSQMMGALSTFPIKVPHLSSLQRLAGHSPNVLPQVRPKTLIPDSLPHSSCREQQSGQILAVPQNIAVLNTKSQGPSLPTANSTYGPESLSHVLEESSISPSFASATSPGVAYAIISATSPAAHGIPGVTEGVKVQPLIFSPDSKVIIIQPQIASNNPSSLSVQTSSEKVVKELTPALTTPNKEEEDPEKVAFMVTLGLVTKDHLDELQSKRQERKRRSTANPAYSGLFEPERKRLASHFLNNVMFLSAQDSEDLCWKEELQHDDHCAVCKQNGDLQPCHTCTRAYHLDCLNPALKAASQGLWMCPKCQNKVLNKENLSWPQSFLQCYITHKSVREEERRKLIKRNTELKLECRHLSEEDQRLCASLSISMEQKEHLLGEQRDTQVSLERLKALIHLIQRDQMIQVTMTATTTSGASLLSLPWIKGSAGESGASASLPSTGVSAVLQKNN